jgi:hypothetical protein
MRAAVLAVLLAAAAPAQVRDSQRCGGVQGDPSAEQRLRSVRSAPRERRCGANRLCRVLPAHACGSSLRGALQRKASRPAGPHRPSSEAAASGAVAAPDAPAAQFSQARTLLGSSSSSVSVSGGGSSSVVRSRAPATAHVAVLLL